MCDEIEACRSRETIARLEAEVERMTKWRRLSELQDKLLAAYRLGGRPSGRVLDEMAKLRALLGPKEGGK
jgi:hypothetical protein